MDLRVSPTRIGEVIVSLKPEFVAVQEILVSQAERIAEQTGLNLAFGAARSHSGEPYGNAIFSVRAAVSSQTFELTVAGREPRSCLHAAFDGVNFFCVHLGTSFFERRLQAPRLVSFLNEFENRIVAGDFNEWTTGLASRSLREQFRYADAARKTYPGVLPALTLDHIYFDDVFHVHKVELVRTRLTLLASDHLPLVASFTHAHKMQMCTDANS